MKIASRWKLTLDPGGTPNVLLALGDWLDSELPWQLAESWSATPLVDAAAPFLRREGNDTYSLDFTVWRSSASDTLARYAIMEGLRTTPALAKKPLRVQLGDSTGLVADYYWTFAAAGVRSYAPQRALDGATARYGTRYSILATGLTKTTA